MGGLEGSWHPAAERAGLAAGNAWALLLAVRRAADRDAARDGGWGFRQVAEGWAACALERAECVVDPRAARLRGTPADASLGWLELIDLHLAHALRTREAGYVLALLGQSLDGFIATHEGHSRYINGSESLIHLHRLRALSDAVVIGVATAVADAPRLTTRHVAGPDPVRVVIDPSGRLPHDCGLLHDGAGPTLVLREAVGSGTARNGEVRLTDQAVALHLPASPAGLRPADMLAALARRGLARILVEGGGATVARFLEADCLDRLQLAVSPVILGGGRPALPVAPCGSLEEARRPASRRYLIGEDVLFDLALRPTPGG